MTHTCAAIAVVDSAVLAAARARAPRKRPSPTPLPPLARNNYLADLSTEARSGKGQAGRNAPGAGAPLGNRNAWKHGVFGKARRARRAAMRAWFEAQDRMMAAAKLFKDFPAQKEACDLFELTAATADALGARFQALQRAVDSHPHFVHRMRTTYET